MSAVAAHAQLPPVRPERIAVRLRPIWLRPVVLFLVVAAHAAALLSFVRVTDDKITVLTDIAVQIVPEGETVTETSSVPTPDVAPVVTADQAVLASPLPARQDAPDIQQAKKEAEQTAAPPEITAPPPKIESEDAPPIPLEQPQVQRIEKPDATVTKPAEKPKEIEVQQASSRAALQAETRADAEIHARQQASLTQLGAPAIRAGVENGAGDAPRMSLSAYGALVSAEVNRHKFYPPDARGAGAFGNVGVVFTIGPAGTVISHSITRSSGNAAIDAAVHAMMAAVQLPAPPGGHFLGSIVIKFSLSP
jgi:periplasmic protein TonB